MSEQKHIAEFVEMLGLLHDIGKLTDEFLRYQSRENLRPRGEPRDFGYFYQIVVDPTEYELSDGTKGALRDKIKQLKRSAGSAAPKPYTILDLAGALRAWKAVSQDGDTYSLAEVINIAHPSFFDGIADATKGESPGELWRAAIGKRMQPAHLVGIMHGAAHYEKEDPKLDDSDLSASQSYEQTYRAATFGDETRIAVDTEEGLTARYQKVAAALAFADRTERLSEFRRLLSAGIGDTQRPVNEVTLWDWGYTAASFAKAALPYIAHHGWPSEIMAIPFQTLAVIINRLEQYGNADKITDLTGLRLTLDEAYDKVQQLIEEELGLGNRFYHDETGAYFLVAEGQLTEELRARIRAYFPADLLPQIMAGKTATPGNLDPKKNNFNVVEPVRRLVAQVRTDAMQEKPVYFDDDNIGVLHGTWDDNGARPSNAERCSVCGQRPVGYPRNDDAAEPGLKLPKWADSDKARRRNVCRVCLARRGRSAEQWAKNGMQRTVWTDEVADDNSRLALFVGELGLDGWLDGGLVSTLVVNKQKQITKNPSPARLYRIAETARTFWDRTVEQLDDVIGQRAHRLALYPTAADVAKLNRPNMLGANHAYELDMDGVLLAVLWDGNCFVTAENLAYFVKRWKPDKAADKEDGGLSRLQARLAGSEFRIMEPTGYGEASFARTTTAIERVEPLGGYTPAISLLVEPSVCMVLVPADKALGLVKEVRERHAAQMGRVRDRLPLHIGLVFFPRRTPIRSVLDAGRRMLAMGGAWRWEEWKVKGTPVHDATTIAVTFENGVTWRIPRTMADGETPDQWYPYFLKAKPANAASEVAFTDLVHVPDLAADNTVWVRPSRFDYEFLDTTARTYDIHYAPDTDLRETRPTRPYLLDDLDRFQEIWQELQHLQRSQRYQVVQTIESTWEGWSTHGEDRRQSMVFRQFVSDTLAGAAWPKRHPWKKIIEAGRDERLIDAGVAGVLADVVELHMQILKEPEPQQSATAPASQ